MDGFYRPSFSCSILSPSPVTAILSASPGAPNSSGCTALSCLWGGIPQSTALALKFPATMTALVVILITSSRESIIRRWSEIDRFCVRYQEKNVPPPAPTPFPNEAFAFTVTENSTLSGLRIQTAALLLNIVSSLVREKAIPCDEPTSVKRWREFVVRVEPKKDKLISYRNFFEATCSVAVSVVVGCGPAALDQYGELWQCW